MPTTAQIQDKLATLYSKRADIEQKMSVAQGRKVKKDSEADARAASAAKASSPGTARSYERQAVSARREALRESDKIASLSKDLARVAKDIGTQQKAFTTAEKAETAATKREADRARRTREADERREQQRRRHDEQKRKNDERRREQQRLADDRAREAEHAAQHAAQAAALAGAEQRFDTEIAALREPKAESLRILYATASPEAGNPLRVDREVKRVKEAVRYATLRDLVEIEHLPAATPADVLSRLASFRPHVVHFAGHADDSALLFDVDGDDFAPHGGHRLDIDLLREMFDAVDEPPVLAVLNACRSAAQLDVLLGPVAVAVGMSDSIGDSDAVAFAARFYAAIAEGQSVGASLAAARVDMKFSGLADHDLPTLMTRDDVDAHEVRLIIGE